MICSFCLAAIEHGTMFYAPKGSPRHLRREIPACNDCWRDAHDKLLAQGYLVGDVINMKVVSTPFGLPLVSVPITDFADPPRTIPLDIVIPEREISFHPIKTSEGIKMIKDAVENVISECDE